VRTLSRQFRAQVGTTPHEWLVRARVDRAKVLLETTSLPIERIAPSVGFGSVAAFRAQFRRIAGTSPLAYRRAFQTAPAGGRQRQKSGSPSSGRSMPTSL
jgi:transcriptional regulator GlxA family with amidase domain